MMARQTDVDGYQSLSSPLRRAPPLFLTSFHLPFLYFLFFVFSLPRGPFQSFISASAPGCSIAHRVPAGNGLTFQDQPCFLLPSSPYSTASFSTPFMPMHSPSHQDKLPENPLQSPLYIPRTRTATFHGEFFINSQLLISDLSLQICRSYNRDLHNCIHAN